MSKLQNVTRDSNTMKFTFDRGTILVRGDVRVPNSSWDERSKSYRAMALYYKDIIDFLKLSGLDFQDEVLDLYPARNFKATSL